MSKIAIISDVNAGLDYIGYDPGIPSCVRSSISTTSTMSTASA